MVWYSLFSHTGSETAKVAELIKQQPELALTTNLNYDGPLKCLKFTSGTLVNDWLMRPGKIEPNSIITLNGYMRILPRTVLEYLDFINCKVFNIHPAPISMYPELRGKDPQERLYEGIQSGEYGLMGVVIHKVDAGVDTGRIVLEKAVAADPSMTKSELYDYLHDMGTELWVEFFREELFNG